MITNGANVNEKKPDGRTALHIAASWDFHPAIVERLLATDSCDVEVKNNKGEKR